MSELRTWVSDSLIKLTGASDSTVVDFVLANASDARSLSSLQDKLSAFLDGPQSELDSFTKDLYNRLPKKHGSTSTNGSAQKTKENGMKEVRKKYKLLEMEDEELQPVKVIDAEKEKKKRRKEESNGKKVDKDTDRERDRDADRDRNRSKKLRERDAYEFDDRWGDDEFVDDKEPDFRESRS